MSKIVETFRKKTDKLFIQIDGYSAKELEDIVGEQSESKIKDYGLNVIVNELILSGSRCRGLEHEGSDLDFVMLFAGNEREDVLFDILNEDENVIGGVKVDINPINVDKTGSLDEYILRVEDYLEKRELLKKSVR